MARGLGYVQSSKIRRTSGKKLNQGAENLPQLLWLLYPFLFVFFIQGLSYGSLLAPFMYLFWNFFSFLITYLLVLLIEFLLWFSLGNKWVSFSLLNFLGLLISLGSRVTLSVADTGLALNNLGIFNDLKLIENADPGIYVSYSLILIPTLVLLYGVIYFMHDWKTVFKNKIPVALGMVLLFVLFSRLVIPGITLRKEEVAQVDKLGVILYFNNGISKKGNVVYPNKEEVAQVMKGIESKDRITATKPDIIMVEIPNFIDLTSRLTLTTDPLTKTHELFAQGSRYRLDLSVKQKDNLNVEFEVLTGLPSEFNPQETQTKGSNVVKGTISLASILAKAGYDRTSILPYPGEEHQRQLFYQNIGFNISRFSEELGGMKMDNIFLGIKETLANGDKPNFIYTHFNVMAESYLGDDLSGYITDLALLDANINRLKEIIAETKRPTIILLYSKSLPTLGEDNKGYSTLGYLKSSYSEMEKTSWLNRGDLFLWNNYNRTGEFPSGNLVDLAFVAELLLSYGDINMPNYFYYTRHLRVEQKVSAIGKAYMEREGILYSTDSKEYKEVLGNYVVVVKDILGPNRFVEESKNKWSVED